MHILDQAHYAVVIAGAGPVGLFLACELRLAGVSVLVLDQAEDPYCALKRLPFGVRGLSAPTIETFYRRGLLDKMATPQRAKGGSGGSSAATGAHWMQQQRRPGGHLPASSFTMTTLTPRNGSTACHTRPVPAWR